VADSCHGRSCSGQTPESAARGLRSCPVSGDRGHWSIPHPKGPAAEAARREKGCAKKVFDSVESSQMRSCNDGRKPLNERRAGGFN